MARKNLIKSQKIMVIFISIVAVILLSVGVYFLTSKEKFIGLLTDEMVYGNFVIKDDHTGSLEEYDKTLYVEGYEGNYDQAYYIKGKITNNSGNNYKFILITFNLLNKKGEIVGEAISGLNNVLKGETYDFKAMSLTTTEKARTVVSYELKSVVEK